MAAPSQEDCNVCVAVKIRPMVNSELDDGCRESLYVTPGAPQVSTGQHTFTYDHVFGNGTADPSLLYSKCVAPLVDGLFKGYNATVFAYGQTGSGKTYTMGSEYKPGGKSSGVIPDAINAIFSRVEANKDVETMIRVSFVEIHKEEIKDLLLPGTPGPRSAISIRETQGGGVALYGAVEKEVRTREELSTILELGTLCRSTASTSMNNRSSRSHAIFTITLEQRRQVQATAITHGGNGASVQTPGSMGAGASAAGDEDGDEDEDMAGEEGAEMDDYLCAKMHLVDLAGSERAKRTKAEGARLKEGIHINRGLLALGNVINAIVDNHKHVPYRDSKLTRLLQDSLGGNSRTVMIACVSPADCNFEESLNTLRYADRARHIRNKPKVNRDPMAAQLAQMRGVIAQLRGENLTLKRALLAAGPDGAAALQALGLAPDGTEGATSAGEGRPANGRASAATGAAGMALVQQHYLEGVVDQLQRDYSAFEQENLRLKLQLDELKAEVASLTDKYQTAHAQAAVLYMQQQQQQQQQPAGSGEQAGPSGQANAQAPWPSNLMDVEIPIVPGQDIVKNYLQTIEQLRQEVKNLKCFAKLAGGRSKRRLSQLHGDAATPGSLSPGPGDDPTAAVLGSPLPVVLEGHGLAGDGEDDMPGGEEQSAEEDVYLAELAAHALSQEQMRKEVALLQHQLEAKERRMAELLKGTGGISMSHLKEHYDRALQELQDERDRLAKEREQLQHKLANASAASQEERKRVEQKYQERLERFACDHKEYKRKEADFVNMQRLKQRTEDAYRRLEADIVRIKQDKVAAMRRLEVSKKQFEVWLAQRDDELKKLRRERTRDRSQIQRLEALQAKQAAVLQRKIAEGNASRKKIKELQEVVARRAAAASSKEAAAAAAAAASSNMTEVQPNGQAPLLRNERACREWLEKELEVCNMSFEFRKVIEAEMAQRAEANRLLKEVEKRLMMLDQLQPSSPQLLPDGSVAPPTPLVGCTPGAVGRGLMMQEPRDKLLEKKTGLEQQIAYHNAQISDLQAQWERQKAAEEERGGGALDVKRWNGIRNIVEARELLRTLFRMSVEFKALNNDLTVEVMRVCEEADVQKVQLDAAQKATTQLRKRLAAMEAAAAAVVPPQAALMPPQDETDKQVDELLEALHEVRTGNTPAVLSNARRLQAGRQPLAVAAAQQQDVSQVAPKALEFLSPVPAALAERQAAHASVQRAAERYSPLGDSDVEMEDAADDDVSMGADDDDIDEDDDAEAASDDEDWDPSHATPVRGNASHRRRRTSAHNTAAAAPNGSRRTSRQHATAQPATHASAGAPMDVAMPAAVPERAGRRSSSLDPVLQSWEAPILDDINLRRIALGLPRCDKLTVRLLKDHLTGKMFGGRMWRAGTKTKEQLIRDYAEMLGLSGGPSPNGPTPGSAGAGAGQPLTPRMGVAANGSPSSTGVAGRPSSGRAASSGTPRFGSGGSAGRQAAAAAAGASLAQAAAAAAARSSPRSASTSSPVAFGSSRQRTTIFAGATGSVTARGSFGFTTSSGSRLALEGANLPGDGAAPKSARDYRAAVMFPQQGSPAVSGSSPGLAGGISALRLGQVLSPRGVNGENMMPSVGTPNSGGKPPTPMSQLYMEKAAAARIRTQELRKSLQRNTEAAAALRGGSSTGVSMSVNGLPSQAASLAMAAAAAAPSVSASMEGLQGARSTSSNGARPDSMTDRSKKAVWR